MDVFIFMEALVALAPILLLLNIPLMSEILTEDRDSLKEENKLSMNNQTLLDSKTEREHIWSTQFH